MGEFETLNLDGCTVPQVVRIMTTNGAKVLGVLRELGTVKAAKLADLAANPAAI